MRDRGFAALGLRVGFGYALPFLYRPEVLQRWKAVRHAGSAMVEFAITAPLLVMLVMGGADFAIMAYNQEALEAATRAGAEYARATPSDGPNWTTTKSQVTGYMSFSPAVTPSASTVCTCVDGTTTACPGTTFCSSHQPTDTRVLQYVSVAATQNFAPLLSYVTFSGMFPSSLTAQAWTRIQ
jgi:Flp pilus assembly protein TadG